MTEETWNLLQQFYLRYPDARSESVEPDEFDASYMDFPVANDYRQFIIKYGGALVGTYPIYGLRLASAMGSIRKQRTSLQITALFQSELWPEVNNWLIFSIDQSGNPIGLTKIGEVWISDSHGPSVAKLADNFEQFLRKWGLKIPS